ncbi:hypothetical protein BHM03_00040146 [Ensete ventricosum]|nr:hypothetical protein BHM03_00040146 [Ensete ventricosum]
MVFSSSTTFDEDVKGRRRLQHSTKTSKAVDVYGLRRRMRGKRLSHDLLPPISGSSREGRARSGRVEVLPILPLILPLLRAPSLSSSFSLDASSSLTTAKLITHGSGRRDRNRPLQTYFER